MTTWGIKTSIAISLIVVLGACSASQTKDETDTESPTAEATPAGTDPVPQANVENPQVDPSSSSGDPSAVGEVAKEAPKTELTPAQTPQNIDSTAGVGSSTTDYTVEKGDTLMKIAFRTYGDLYKWKMIYEANKEKISNPNSLAAGTLLKLEKPANPVTTEQDGEKYLIQPGDTLGAISNSLYGTKSRWKELWEKNKQMIHNPNQIFASFYLFYAPEASAASQAASSVLPPAEMGGTAPQQDTPAPMASSSDTIVLPPGLVGSTPSNPVVDPNAGNTLDSNQQQ